MHNNPPRTYALLPHMSFFNRLVLLVMVLWACPTHAQQAMWEERTQAGKEAQHRGNYALARQHFLAAIEAAKIIGSEDPRLGVSLNDMAQVHKDLGDYNNAETFLKNR